MKYMLFRTITLISLAFFATFVTADGIDPENKSITISLQVEPPNLDTSLSEDTTSGLIIRLMNEGLVRFAGKEGIIGAVAESWEITDTHATFKLRDNARWVNGEPVTAHDFVYAWKRLVNPETAASGSTFFTYVLKNAPAILSGDMPVDSLGVKALDDHTLYIELSHPVPYLLTVLIGTPYMPLNEAFVEAQDGRFAAEADNLLSNGPFMMETWVHNSEIRMTRNPHFWNADELELERIDVGYITSDVRSLLNLYKSGELAQLALNEEILEDAMGSGLSIKRTPTNCIAWIFMNMQPGRVTSNKKVRQAMRMAFDRQSYVNQIVGIPGTRVIDSFFTKRINGVKRNFQREFPAPKIEFDIANAKQLLEEAKSEMGVDEIPSVTLLANETRQIEAEFIQAQLGSALGLDIKVDKQTFKQAIAKMNNHDFDIARAAFCSGAFRDPVFFAGILQSDGPFNSGAFVSEEYDRLMAITHSTGDQQIRMSTFAKMQQLIYDEAPIIPSHEVSVVYVEDERLGGLVRYPVADYSRGFIR